MAPITNIQNESLVDITKIFIQDGWTFNLFIIFLKVSRNFLSSDTFPRRVIVFFTKRP